MENGIGQHVPRKEDHRLLTGQGTFSDDFNEDGQAYGFVLRCPHAHADIKSIDGGRAATMPGVLAVLSGADYVAEGLGPIPGIPIGGDIIDPSLPAVSNQDGSDIFTTPMYPMPPERVRHIGEAVALVVAESLNQAKDAAEQVVVDYAVLPAVTDMARAVADGAPELWPGAPNNVCLDLAIGDAAATAAAFAAADRIVAMDLANNRVTAVAMEPRAALAAYDAEAEFLTLYAGGQGVVLHRRLLARSLGMAVENVRVVAKDVGGGFGMRNALYPEFVLVAWAARKLGRPVKWTAERGESFLSDYQAREVVTRGELALDADGRFLGLRIDHLYSVGAYTAAFVALANGIRLVTSTYDIPAAAVTARAVLTNTLPTAPYRGAGRPEAMFNLERLIDRAAAELDLDRVEIRRQNLIPPSAFPYMNPTGIPYDCGEFAQGMDKAVALADWAGFAARRRESAANGMLRGIGIANYLETPTGQPKEWTQVSVGGDGQVDVIIGTGPSGQGQETVFSQVISEWLGVPFQAVNVRIGDTAYVKEGGGSHSNRSMRLGGTILVESSEVIIARGKRIAAHLFEASAADIAFQDGAFTIAGTDRSMTIFAVAAAAESGAELPDDLKGPLAAATEISRRLPAYPNGAAVGEVEIDPQTGAVRLTAYTAVDDVGTVINPLIVHGQVHGGIAQGVGQALFEDMVYDAGNGQMLSGSFLDYCLPRADDLPSFTLGDNTVVAPSNPLGVKGGGEGGTTPALAAIINAVVDALGDYGVEHMAMPATSERIWRAIGKAD